MTVLEGVELRPELISAVIGRVTAEGIEWREAGELLSDEGLDTLASEVFAVARAERPRRESPEPRRAISGRRAGPADVCGLLRKKAPRPFPHAAGAYQLPA